MIFMYSNQLVFYYSILIDFEFRIKKNQENISKVEILTMNGNDMSGLPDDKMM